MASLFYQVTRRAILSPSLFCSVGPSSLVSSSSRGFSSTSATPKPSGEKGPQGHTQQMTDLLNEVDFDGSIQDPSNLLNHLSSKELHVISPSRLSPRYLLIPYLPQPDRSLAYPLGPPKSEALRLDPFVRLNIDPLASPMNPYLRSEYCTSMGKIKGRGKTGLQRRSQRRLGKAVRRARSMGIIPTFGISLPADGSYQAQ
ncbi:hypothetical protein MVLG_04228 [Microbotryum lychnidis-dioicae p1A1 Lamole]|uniref:Small ribosomal subunit protein bS18m n=1 Tax=Microbotryum lychnidis-dioicae (strain p1A1 Lamole / MvSl-1064) TaxID=683840 RepID=U5HAK3_USTV1|nr:hypothetical protein MVLG_04228 [Microbotryum lychnidis-dioicae p1A1 Lamole]|eukprot:KDE05433.1 hypothetical protein MVLG_04228 [Microbotryum lychnidis-dioicae p1A1 Lamole]